MSDYTYFDSNGNMIVADGMDVDEMDADSLASALGGFINLLKGNKIRQYSREMNTRGQREIPQFRKLQKDLKMLITWAGWKDMGGSMDALLLRLKSYQIRADPLIDKIASDLTSFNEVRELRELYLKYKVLLTPFNLDLQRVERMAKAINEDKDCYFLSGKVKEEIKSLRTTANNLMRKFSEFDLGSANKEIDKIEIILRKLKCPQKQNQKKGKGGH